MHVVLMLSYLHIYNVQGFIKMSFLLVIKNFSSVYNWISGSLHSVFTVVDCLCASDFLLGTMQGVIIGWLNWGFTCHTHTPPFYGHYTGQPALAGTSIQELKDFVGAKFCCPPALANSNQHIRIRKKLLEFSSTVLSTLSPYLISWVDKV